MSAIKINSLKMLFSIFLLLTLFSCNKENSDKKLSSRKPEEITFIGLSYVGGEQGNYRIIKITKDSIHLETGTNEVKKHKSWKKSITPETWKKLTSWFKIKDLSLVESSPSIQSIDGIDESFQIKTTKKSHVFVNAYNDVHYKQFESFKNQLNTILPQEIQ